MGAAPWEEAGFHGKLPARGDFVTRRIPAPAVEALDTWMQEGIAHSRAVLGERWLELYLTSPVWHFALEAGIAGPAPVAGLLIPSVDQVGRYFPMLVAAPWGGDATLAGLAARSDWRRRAEAAALLALEEGVSFERFDEAVAALGLPEADAPPPDPLTLACAALAEHALRERHGRLGLWWSEGSEQVPPALLACAELPPPEVFTCLLDGDWLRAEGHAVTFVPGAQPAPLAAPSEYGTA